ncbi:dynamin family protein [Actinotalea subterranea]|uniref:dynamin family protein n=1 Tax=Actinotalea subterranea TaxID=2607497 RepID=UPI0011EE217E|nr:dynamin family protein [Actinotalea subterranea]
MSSDLVNPRSVAGGGTGSAAAAPPADRPRASASLLDAVADLRRDVDATRFPLELEGVAHAQARRSQLLDQLDDHLLPRLRELSAPAVVVVAGSTGAGKSTIVNSLLGEEVSAAGVLRPTTRRPVLAHHPDDAELLAEHPLSEAVEVVARPAVPRGVALVDAPDLDSLLESNRAMAHRLLEAADLWVFVTTAARYGDALPWQVLDRASARGASMAMVLNRVPSDALLTVRSDLMHRLRERGMAAVPLFLVPDVGPHEGLLDPTAVAPIRRWLAMVAGPDRARSVIARTQRGALAALRPWVDDLAEAVQAQVDARVRLQGIAADAVVGPAERTALSVAEGGVVDGPVRGTWGSVGPAGSAWGRRWTARRGRTGLAAALTRLDTELRAALVVTLDSAQARAARAVHTALATSKAPGAATVVAALAERGDASGEHTAGRPDAAGLAGAVDAWVASVDAAVEVLLGAGDRRAQRRASRLVRAVGRPGATTMVAVAAAGLGEARDVLAGALGGDTVDELLAPPTERLTILATERARAGRAAAFDVLDSDDLADDAASRLRLRLAVLKGLT